jgi:hypothetical protein
MKIQPRLLCLFLALTAALTAQPDAQESVSLEFRLMAWGGDVPALTYGAQKKKIEPTEINLRSMTHAYTGPATLGFSLHNPSVDESKPAPVIATVNLPKDARKVTILTMPTGRGRFAMYSISEDAMPPRHSRLHNLSTEPLLVAYNMNDKAELAPGGSLLVNNIVELSETGSTNVLLSPGPQGGGLGMFALAEWPSTPVPGAEHTGATPP